MGGLVIFTAIGVPYLILSERDAASMAVFGTALASAGIGFADDWLKIVKARSLGLSARTKLALQLLIAIGLWFVATRGRRAQRDAPLPDLRLRTSTSAASTSC